MARRRIRVDKIKEVIRYGVTTELSERAIGRALKVSRIAVTKYLEWFRRSGLTWEQAQELPDSELVTALESNRVARTNARYERLAERFPTMVKELRRKGVTLQLLWEEYLREHPDGYQSSQFGHHFHGWCCIPRRFADGFPDYFRGESFGFPTLWPWLWAQQRPVGDASAPRGGRQVSERQVVIRDVLVGGRWRHRVVVELVVFLLRGIVATQLAVVAVFDRGGDEVEALHEVGDGSVAEIIRQWETQRAA